MVKDKNRHKATYRYFMGDARRLINSLAVPRRNQL
jgi:hypothetical protein